VPWGGGNIVTKNPNLVSSTYRSAGPSFAVSRRTRRPAIALSWRGRAPFPSETEPKMALTRRSHASLAAIRTPAEPLLVWLGAVPGAALDQT